VKVDDGAQRAQFPAVLGSSAHADVEISGYYMSARHCTLHWDGEQLWLLDHSTNGTWVDGECVRRGSRVALANGALLGFGRDRGTDEHDRYPAVRAQLMRNSAGPDASATPVAPSRSTPVAPGIASPPSTRSAGLPDEAPLGTASSTPAAAGDVLKLPFTIGRGSLAGLRRADANQGVSREHLVIESIDDAGQWRSTARWSAHLRRQPAAARSASSGALVREIVLGEEVDQRAYGAHRALRPVGPGA
jgi:hypothetical protein